MDQCRACGCKGRRSCLVCETQYQIIPEDFIPLSKREQSYVFCPFCNKAWPGWSVQDEVSRHPNHSTGSIPFSGVYIQQDFLTEEEVETLKTGIESEPWDPSQSGRRKQNYGPKCNFRKNKLQLGEFEGFPAFSTFVQDKFSDVSILQGFRTIEQCSLEYDPSKGASIDPHIDDCWVWGERVVTVNIEGYSVLTLTKYKGDRKKYNLEQVAQYPAVLKEDGSFATGQCFEWSEEVRDIVVRVGMPARSLIVLYGSARYEWEHCVLREDVNERRVCLAYREFTPPYLPGGNKENIARQVFEKLMV